MSVLKSLDIDLPQSEKRTLVSFLSLYIFFTIVILSFVMQFYYNFQKDLMIGEKRIILVQYASELIIELKNINTKPVSERIYPMDKRFKSAIYDSNSDLIFSTIKNPKIKLDQIIYNSDETIQYIKDPKSSYLGATYVLVKIVHDEQWQKEIIYTIILYGIIVFVIILFIGYFLSKLFLKPMRDALHLLDTFIKDTTHELNTPVSTIVANIEMIDTKNMDDEKLVQKINRIDIGAKTISNIYEDLTYLVLNNKIISQDKNLNLAKVCEQRIEYFSTLATVKEINISTDLDTNIMLYIDQKKISKVIDNLISNAIKYNKFGGSIHITLAQNTLSIKDTGCGISKENIDLMFDRYVRFDKSVGGFGIGLNIVKLICDEYNLSIKIISQVGVGTDVQIEF
ncbi:MAG: HAMP domain-containing histidine kinase [Arcobacteraceae bacterium]|nr:HAMP domain-containing histidine kinase [Arcobacteraceae bacterium]